MKSTKLNCLPIFILITVTAIILLFCIASPYFHQEETVEIGTYHESSTDNGAEMPAQNPFKFAILPDGTASGYALDVYTSESDHHIPIKMSNWDDEVHVTFDIAGVKEQGALQVFIDYKQVPINIDGEIYRTYFFDADKNISSEISFQLVESIDTNYDHSMIVALHANTKSLTYLEDGNLPAANTSAVNYRITFGHDNGMFVAAPMQEYEHTDIMKDQMWSGLFLNSDTKLERKRILDEELHVAPGEEVQLLYQVGHYKNGDESAIIIVVGFEQVKINNHDYILVKTDDGKLRYGILSITAPLETGEYEVTGWPIRDPFFTSNGEPMSFYESPRFTLIVEE